MVDWKEVYKLLQNSSERNKLKKRLLKIFTNTASKRINDFGIRIKELTHESIKEGIIKAV